MAHRVMAVSLVVALVPGALGWGFGIRVANNAPRYTILPTPGAFSWDYMDTPSATPGPLTGSSGASFGYNFKCSGGFSSSTSIVRLAYDVTCPDAVYTWRIAVQLYCRHELWSTTWDSPATVSVTAPQGPHPCAVFSVPIDVHGSPQGLGEGGTLVVTITDFGPPPPPHASVRVGGRPPQSPVSSPCGSAPSDPVLYAEQSQPLVNGPFQGRYLSPAATQGECVQSFHGRCCSREKGGTGLSAVNNALPCGFCYASTPALLHQHLGAGEPYVDGGANAGGVGVPPAPLVGCSCQTTFIGTCNLRANTCAAGTHPQCAYNGAGKYCTCACH